MKKFNRILSTISALAVVLCFAACESGSSGTPAIILPKSDPEKIKYDWQEQYRKKLSSYMASSEFSSDAATGSAFDIFDVTGDGSPELIISPNTDPATSCLVFEFKDDSLNKIGELGNGGVLSYLPEKNMIKDEYHGADFVLGKYVSYIGGELVPAITYNDNSQSAASGGTIIHEIDGVEVMLSDYEAALEPYTGAVSFEIGRRYTFGEGAINYAIKLAECWPGVFNSTDKELCRNKLNEILAAAPEGTHPAFDFCDLNGDKVPELIVSEDSAPEAMCSVYYLNVDVLEQMDGTYGFCGQFTFDPKELVFFYDVGGIPTYWSIANAGFTAAGYNNDGNSVQIGRKYLLTDANISRFFG